jgi:hypothetical protein
MMLKRRIALWLAIAILALTNVAWGHGSSQHFAAVLTGGQEVPPVPTGAVGFGSLEVNSDRTVLHFAVAVANIENVVAAHIHVAPAGSNGPVVVTLCGNPGGAPPCMNLPGKNFVVNGHVTQTNSGGSLDHLIEQMRAGNAYINVHTPTWPGGEVRGQIAAKHP